MRFNLQSFAKDVFSTNCTFYEGNLSGRFNNRKLLKETYRKWINSLRVANETNTH